MSDERPNRWQVIAMRNGEMAESVARFPTLPECEVYVMQHATFDEAAGIWRSNDDPSVWFMTYPWK